MNDNSSDVSEKEGPLTLTYDNKRSDLDDKSNNGKNNDDTGDNNRSKDYVVTLDISESLQQQQILKAFVVNTETGCVIASLNHVYQEKTIVSDIYQNWIKTIDAFATRAKEKGISDEHIAMLTDALDNNNEKIMQCLYDQRNGEDNGNAGSDKNAVALELVKDRIIDTFLDEVKAPYAVIKVDGHIETVPIKSQRFEDWIGALYYYHEKEGVAQFCSKRE